jgi:penicillin amidase
MLAHGLRRLAAVIGGIVLALILVIVVYVAYVGWTTHTAVAATGGTRSGMGVDGPITIARDARGIAHIRATTDRDLFYAEGYAVGSDRLWQLDLLRRYCEGRLAEVLGAPLVDNDKSLRTYELADAASRIYAKSTAEERSALDAFAAGINAAAATQPEPAEFRAFFYHFEPWQPRDAIVVGYATVLDLVDGPSDIALREHVRQALGTTGVDALFPLSDPRYDVPTDNRPPAPLAPLPTLPGAHDVAFAPAISDERVTIGSNGWTVGGARTADGRATMASDPHLSLRMPGVWWLVEARSPHLHIAGASLAGTPGVILGHNDHIAWGATNGGTVAMRLFKETLVGDTVREAGRVSHISVRHETIGVRLGAPVSFDVRSTPRGLITEQDNATIYVADWPQLKDDISPLTAFFGLDAAPSLEAGFEALRTYPGPVQNFVMADDRGRSAYHLAGIVINDPRWARSAFPDTTPLAEAPFVAFDQLAHVDPTRDTVVVSSNNRSVGNGEPQSAPYWSPPYRAWEIRHDLGTGRGLTSDAVGAPQFDDSSPAELEFAKLILASADHAHASSDATLAPIIDALRHYDGRMIPSSQGASAETAVRLATQSRLIRGVLSKDLAKSYLHGGPAFEVTLRALRERPKGWVPHDDYDAFVTSALHDARATMAGAVPTFGDYAAMPLKHPLAQFGFRLWNGATLPGRSGPFAPAVQWNAHGQSYRALWIGGDWDHGAIDIDAGESGEPGSPHYRDQSADWISRQRHTLPFSDDAVRAATVETLTLNR